MAGRDVLEVAADVAALLDGDVAAKQERRDQLGTLCRIRIHLLADQLPRTKVPCEWPIRTHAAAIVVRSWR